MNKLFEIDHVVKNVLNVTYTEGNNIAIAFESSFNDSINVLYIDPITQEVLGLDEYPKRVMNPEAQWYLHNNIGGYDHLEGKTVRVSQEDIEVNTDCHSIQIDHLQGDMFQMWEYAPMTGVNETSELQGEVAII